MQLISLAIPAGMAIEKLRWKINKEWSPESTWMQFIKSVTGAMLILTAQGLIVSGLWGTLGHVIAIVYGSVAMLVGLSYGIAWLYLKFHTWRRIRSERSLEASLRDWLEPEDGIV